MNLMSTYRGVNICLAKFLNSVLNVKALVGAFSVIANLRVDLRLKLYSRYLGNWAHLETQHLASGGNITGKLISECFQFSVLKDNLI